MDIAALSISLSDGRLGRMETLAKAVRGARLAQGMRGIDLAQALGKDPSYVTKLEHGTLKEIPDPATLGKLSAALGIPEPDLLALIGFRVRERADPVVSDHRLREIVAAWPRLDDGLKSSLAKLMHDVIEIHGALADADEEPPIVALAR